MMRCVNRVARLVVVGLVGGERLSAGASSFARGQLMPQGVLHSMVCLFLTLVLTIAVDLFVQKLATQNSVNNSDLRTASTVDVVERACVL